MRHSNIIISLLYLRVSSFAYFLVRADDAEAVDPCIALQERMIDIYNDPGCTHARMLIEERDFWAGEAPPDPKGGDPPVCSEENISGFMCGFNVSEVLYGPDHDPNGDGGFVGYGCEMPEPAEEHAEFVYTVYENRAEFSRSGEFYCNWDDCYSIVRDVLLDPIQCNITNPLSDEVDAYKECFRSVPCDCVRDFSRALRDPYLPDEYTASDEFLEIVGLPKAIIDAASQAAAYGSDLCGDVDTEPPSSGGHAVGIYLHSHAALLLVASTITLVAYIYST